MPLRDDDAYMDLVQEVALDKWATWVLLYEMVITDFPNESADWAATRATHLAIGMEKEMYHKVREGYVTQDHASANAVVQQQNEEPVDPALAEYDEREQAVYQLTDGRSFKKLVADNHDAIKNGEETGEILKRFGFPSLPPGDRRQWVDLARIAWRAADRKAQGMKEYFVMTATANEFSIPHDQLVDLPPNPDEDDTENGIPF
jgi:hypothetical protein